MPLKKCINSQLKVPNRHNIKGNSNNNNKDSSSNTDRKKDKNSVNHSIATPLKHQIHFSMLIKYYLKTPCLNPTIQLYKIK